MKEPDHWAFTRHLLLWAKGWYPSLGGDKVEAMRQIMAEVSGTELVHVGKADAVEFIVRAFHELTSPARASMAMTGFWRTVVYQNPAEPTELWVNTMVSELRHTYPAELPPLGNPDLQFHLNWLHRKEESEQERDEDLDDFREDYPLCPGCSRQFYACESNENCDITIGPPGWGRP